MIADKAGNLYGTTYYGGIGGFSGVVFKVVPGGSESVLYSFCPDQTNCDDGINPASSLIADRKGNLYGTTNFGGGNNPGGDGTVFKVSPGGEETVLHAFDFQTGDGVYPDSALIEVKKDFYGTTSNGGAGGVGTVFRLKK